MNGKRDGPIPEDADILGAVQLTAEADQVFPVNLADMHYMMCH
ncbi:hypothetical protein MKX42_21990 [Paenibacillus sp. FSL R7-0204]